VLPGLFPRGKRDFSPIVPLFPSCFADFSHRPPLQKGPWILRLLKCLFYGQGKGLFSTLLSRHSMAALFRFSFLIHTVPFSVTETSLVLSPKRTAFSLFLRGMEGTSFPLSFLPSQSGQPAMFLSLLPPIESDHPSLLSPTQDFLQQPVQIFIIKVEPSISVAPFSMIPALCLILILAPSPCCLLVPLRHLPIKERS